MVCVVDLLDIMKGDWPLSVGKRWINAPVIQMSDVELARRCLVDETVVKRELGLQFGVCPGLRPNGDLGGTATGLLSGLPGVDDCAVHHGQSAGFHSPQCQHVQVHLIDCLIR